MRKLLIILCTLIAVGVFAQEQTDGGSTPINPNSATYAYQSVAQAIKSKKKAGWKFDVIENGVVSHFITMQRTGIYAQPDSIMVVAMADSVTVAVRQAQEIQLEWFKLSTEKDWYKAIQRMVRYVNFRHGKVTIALNPVEYYVDTFLITGGTRQNTIKDFAFQNCKNLTIKGYGAKISLRGNFNRSKDIGAASWTNPVSIRFDNCTDLSIKGLEVDGHVQDMTKDAGVAEGGGYGLIITSCTNVTLGDLKLHHTAVDGLYVGSVAGTTPLIATKNLIATNVNCYSNGRQGASIVQLANATFMQCNFDSTRYNIGNYGGNSPGYGVDIEPNADTPVVDVSTKNIEFIGCTFRGNIGVQLSVGTGSYNVTADHCFFDNSLFNAQYVIIGNSYNLTVKWSHINTGTGAIWPAWGNGLKQSSLWQHNQVFTRGNGFFVAVTAQYGVVIDDNDVWQLNDTPFHSHVPYILNPAIVTNNRFHYSKKAYTPGNPPYFLNVLRAENNVFTSDITNANGDSLIAPSFSGNQIGKNRFPVNGAVKPSGAWLYDTLAITNELVATTGPFPIYKNPTTSQADSHFDLSDPVGSKISNYYNLTSPAVPIHTPLTTYVRNSAGYLNGWALVRDIASSGMYFATHGSNAGTITAGAFQQASTLFWTYEPSMSGIQFNLGRVYIIGKTGQTAGSFITPDNWLIIDSNGMANNRFNPTARLNLRANSTAFPSIQFDLAGAAAKTTPVRGGLEAVSNFLLYTDSTATRDTLATMRWARGVFSSGGGLSLATNTVPYFNGTALASSGMTYNNATGTDTITATGGDGLVIRRNVGATMGEMDFAGSDGRTITVKSNGVSANLNLNTTQLVVNGSIKVGAQKSLLFPSWDGTVGNYVNLFDDAGGNFYWQINGINAITANSNGRVNFKGPVNLQDFTVATLPTTPFAKDVCFVSDALNPVNGSPVVGGGTSWVPVYRNNSNQWIVMGAGTGSSTLTLTTTGTSGPATLTGSTLNIPVIPTSFWQRTATTLRPLNAGDNLTVDGSLKVGTLPTGTTSMKAVVWDNTDSAFKQVAIVNNGLSTVNVTTATATIPDVPGNKVVVLVNFAGAATITLPAASTNSGKEVTVKSITANSVSITPVFASDANTIGASTFNAYTYYSNGTTWFMIARN